MNFVDEEHLGMRLRDSVVRLSCTPYLVTEIYQGGIVNGFFGNRFTMRQAVYWELDLRPIPLGFVNVERYCLYAYRLPSRLRGVYKQGICNDTLGTAYQGMGLNDLFPYLLDSTYGIYPTLDEIYNMYKGGAVVRGNYPLKAFSRYFAINPTTNQLFYKTDLVGVINPDKTFQLEKFALCLTELLEETLDVS